MLGTEDGMRRAGRADNNVGLAGRLIELLEWNDTTLKDFSHAPCAFLSAVGYKNRAGALLHKMPRGEFAHLACTNKENRAPIQ